MNLNGKSGIEMVVGFVFFLIIIGMLLFQGVFTELIKAFSIPEFGGFGLLMGILLVLMIVITLFDRLIGR